jgi:NADH:ubiquinone oxidoreductase subunit 5 (subunit L)/multisubunit Na+/H+ antiporter MnhA subunit
MYPIEKILKESIGLFVLIPFLGFLLSLLWQNKQEKPISKVVYVTKLTYFFSALAYAVLWLINEAKPISVDAWELYDTTHFVFAIQFYYDALTAVYSIVGAILFFLVIKFSRYYMHRDEGYKRFFNCIFLFAIGYNFIICSGNFETMFIGWEMVGLSSFLLIAFYRNRYLPVRNGFKVLSYYRLSDIALILAMWMMHHLTHQNVSFTQLSEAKNTALQNNQTGMAAFISLMFLLAAMIKSAQVPFTSWLPRAMEGPTTSSAIFYGSLSVHIGLFLLLRTYPFWQDFLPIKIIIILVGAATAFIANLIARVQPTAKTQIAYAAAAQIGLIFIEIAMGLHWLALVHFAGNAFLRTYQLLVSPSILNYLIHHQYFHQKPGVSGVMNTRKASLYVLGIKEWNMDSILYKVLWNPFKKIGKKLTLLDNPVALFITFLAAGMFFPFSNLHPKWFLPYQNGVAVALMLMALLLILFSFASRGKAMTAWGYLFSAHTLIVSAVNLQTLHADRLAVAYYLFGISFPFLIGALILKRIESNHPAVTLNRYWGLSYQHKNQALVFTLAAIGILGFPITMAFIGIDVIFTYVEPGQVMLITLLALCFLFVELAAIRILIRVFFGPHFRTDHPVAFRST